MTGPTMPFRCNLLEQPSSFAGDVPDPQIAFVLATMVGTGKRRSIGPHLQDVAVRSGRQCRPS